MKKSIISLLSLTLALAVGLGACSNEAKDAKKSAPKTAQTTKNPADLPNYRYVDIDTVLSRYNLSKDYNEDMIARQNSFEAEARKHENSIKSFATSMQNKYQNNQYTEQSYNADQAKMQQMQTNAQSAMERLQNANAKAAMDAEKVIQDSIQHFINDYNATHHYDAILYKNATLYIDPALDITDEVVEGLNARYNKVKK